MEWNEEVRAKLVKELGDVMWYVAFIARNVLDVTVKDILEANVEKLNQRYKSGKFTTREFMAKEDCKKE
jgi:NTP pyrophosphatase (non-canonical NTP hydrolase)